MVDYRELKDMLCNELEKIVKKGEMTTGALDVIDKLTHSIKSVETIMAMNGYSHNSYAHDWSYARRRDSMGRYSNGYSRDSELIAELRGLMDDAHDEKTRVELRKFINKLESSM